MTEWPKEHWRVTNRIESELCRTYVEPNQCVVHEGCVCVGMWDEAANKFAFEYEQPAPYSLPETFMQTIFSILTFRQTNTGYEVAPSNRIYSAFFCSLTKPNSSQWNMLPSRRNQTIPPNHRMFVLQTKRIKLNALVRCLFNYVSQLIATELKIELRTAKIMNQFVSVFAALLTWQWPLIDIRMLTRNMVKGLSPWNEWCAKRWRHSSAPRPHSHHSTSNMKRNRWNGMETKK